MGLEAKNLINNNNDNNNNNISEISEFQRKQRDFFIQHSINSNQIVKKSENIFDISREKSKRELRLRRYCHNLKPILSSPVQQNFCYRNVKLMEIVSKGASLAIDECQHQFKYKRWNCTVYDSKTSVFGQLSLASKYTIF